MNFYLENKSVSILNTLDLERTNSNIALVRLNNHKLALMVRKYENPQEWEPFYPMGIETGFWDSRNVKDIDYDKVFENYRKLGANTCWFMLHWKDIEPQKDRFDFRFADEIVAKARKHYVKIVWVYFNHAHCNDPCLNGDNFWAYRMDSSDGKDRAIQWIKDDNGNLYDCIEKMNTLDYAEIFPCYSNPVVFERIKKVIKEIAKHYRHSDTVIGIQIGNEEGFLHAPQLKGYDSDFNPCTLELYEKWKASGKISWMSFKQWMVKWWWRNFTTAFHEEDPYKLTSFNLHGGYPENGMPEWIYRTGTDITTYGEGNIDSIGTMFYEKNFSAVWENIDRHYDCVYSLPIFIPSEIGLGIHGTKSYVLSQHFLIKALARGAQGFDIYAYGHFFDKQNEINVYGEILKKWNGMINDCIDVIWSGLPGCNGVKIETSTKNAAINCLTGINGATLGILHFPAACNKHDVEKATDLYDILIDITVHNPGEYELTTLHDGETVQSERLSIRDQNPVSMFIRGVREKSMTFIQVRKI